MLSSSRPRDLPHPAGPKLSIVRWENRIKPQRLNPFFEKAKFSASSSWFRPTLLHPTYYVKPSAFFGNLPVVYTVYDMIHEKWRNRLDYSGSFAAAKKSCFERASAIACISESTRNDLLEMYPHLEAKTSVIYLAGEIKQGDPASSDLCAKAFGCSYLLYVGARASYKNFFRLAVAFSRVACQISGLRLKVAGPPFSGPELDLLEALDISNSVDIYADVSDSVLHSLYRNALAFVYPSMYEGFGIPPLEAMALKTPVLASRSSSIPEVVGDAALMFNPYSVESIADAIVHIVMKPELREDLRQRGLRQCTKFSWEKTADQYIDLYEQLVCG
jgi:glycosyltransferase involved in cell wall biosynthesis